MGHINNDVFQELIDEYQKVIDTVEISPDTAAVYMFIVEGLQELLERRSKDCEHKLVSIKNEKIDSGYICIYCGHIFQEATPNEVKEKLNAE